MNYKNKLNQIRVVLGLHVKLATAKLEDGVTVVESEDFQPGSAIEIVAEDGTKSPAPAGEHILEDGSSIVVDEKGTIVSVEPKAAEDVEKVVEKDAAKVKMDATTDGAPMAAAGDKGPIDGSEPNAPKKADAVDEKIAEAMKKVMMAIEPIMNDMAEMKAKMAKMEESYSKFAKAPAASKISTISESAKHDFSNKNSIDIVDRFKELKNSLNK
jgi:hypothetical protein